jgi:hypothetical protein
MQLLSAYRLPASIVRHIYNIVAAAAVARNGGYKRRTGTLTRCRASWLAAFASITVTAARMQPVYVIRVPHTE